jgi:hypothetical protein
MGRREKTGKSPRKVSKKNKAYRTKLNFSGSSRDPEKPREMGEKGACVDEAWTRRKRMHGKGSDRPWALEPN